MRASYNPVGSLFSTPGSGDWRHLRLQRALERAVRLPGYLREQIHDPTWAASRILPIPTAWGRQENGIFKFRHAQGLRVAAS
jgi:hypothetical protein